MEGKKISFSFLKTKKVDKPVVEEKKEFIECMEEKSIKVVGGEEVKETAPLVIPLKPNTLVTAERLKQIADEVESVLTETEPESKKNISEPQLVPENETLDQMVVRELLQGAKEEVKTESMDLTVPIPAKTVMQGQKESTLEDYDDVPVQEFGLAMLRGMGWTASQETNKYKQPQLRPKGLGLGADKVIKENQKKKPAANDKEEELAIVKNSFVKVTTGKYSGYYGKVVSLDEDNGRVMVDITVKKETVSLSEFMMQPVTKAEFDKESKVINADSFDEYKRTDKVTQKVSKTDTPRPERAGSSNTKDVNSEKQKDEIISKKSHEDTERNLKKSYDDEGRSRDKYRRDSSEERSRKTHKTKKKNRRHSSSDSLSSLSDKEKRRKHKSSRKRYSTTDSDSDSPKREKRKRSPEKKRDIDKKRKGKKKKRDRDRSPNYKKHRK